ncbi:MAG: class I SAM-dependent methyltransferase [Phycisphaeraceae bacterium]|nr:class I SAM-dependent methyltransferase [Phycisphaeraceae bacterium]
MSSAFWNERYAAAGLAYGDAPNEFLAHVAERLPRTGRAIDIGAGQGRNALFLASLGLDVLAVDQSEVGMRRAGGLAKERGLKLGTVAADLRDFDAEAGAFAVVSSIFVHLPAELRALVHARVARWLAPGGVFVLEAYAPAQIERATGGPKDPTIIASLAQILSELSGLTIEHQAEAVRNVNEGSYHSGEASVVQVVARKP